MLKVKGIRQSPTDDPIKKRLDSFVTKVFSEEVKSDEERKRECGLRKLQVSMEAARLIKEHSTDSDGNGDTVAVLPVASTSTAGGPDSLLPPVTGLPSTRQTNDREQGIIEYLLKLDDLRDENRLVYGLRKTGEGQLINFGLGLETQHDGVNHYRKKFSSTDASTYFAPDASKQTGAVEFGITYDNKFFLVPQDKTLQVLAYGTFLKAVGCIQIATTYESIRNDQIGTREGFVSVIEKGQVKYISVYNTTFATPIENIAVSLFVLQQLGVDLSATKVVVPNEQLQLVSDIDRNCRIKIRGEIIPASYYLEPSRFPKAKKIAEGTRRSIVDELTELFLSIDDEVLNKRNKKILTRLQDDKGMLKLSIIQFILHAKFGKNKELEESSAATVAVPEQDKSDTQSKTTSSDHSSNTGHEAELKQFNELHQVINTSISFFKENGIDLSFLDQEVNYLLAYTLHNGLTPEEKEQLKCWCESVSEIPCRNMDDDSFSSFYVDNPERTCIALLEDYTKGRGLRGAVKRFFSGAWNRNHVKAVNEVLSLIIQNPSDKWTICTIFEELRKVDLSVSLNSQKSTLSKRILFCAKLSNEEAALRQLADSRLSSSINESEYAEDDNRQRLSAAAERLKYSAVPEEKGIASISTSPSFLHDVAADAIATSVEKMAGNSQGEDEFPIQGLHSRSNSFGSARAPVFFQVGEDSDDITQQQERAAEHPQLQTSAVLGTSP